MQSLKKIHAWAQMQDPLCLMYSLDSNDIFFHMFYIEPGNILDKMGRVSRQSPQLQRLARKLKFHL